jgi:hypothetical protein
MYRRSQARRGVLQFRENAGNVDSVFRWSPQVRLGHEEGFSSGEFAADTVVLAAKNWVPVFFDARKPFSGSAFPWHFMANFGD